MADPVANPLTLVMDIKSPQDYVDLRKLIETLQATPTASNPISAALTKLSMVHFARFVFLSEQQLAIITTYDGSFEDYIDAFVNAIGGVFDQLFAHVKDAPPSPIASNAQAFLQYVQAHDLKCVPPFYSAYPNLRVLDILTMEQKQGTP